MYLVGDLGRVFGGGFGACFGVCFGIRRGLYFAWGTYDHNERVN